MVMRLLFGLFAVSNADALVGTFKTLPSSHTNVKAVVTSTKARINVKKDGTKFKCRTGIDGEDVQEITFRDCPVSGEYVSIKNADNIVHVTGSQFEETILKKVKKRSLKGKKGKKGKKKDKAKRGKKGRDEFFASGLHDNFMVKVRLSRAGRDSHNRRLERGARAYSSAQFTLESSHLQATCNSDQIVEDPDMGTVIKCDEDIGEVFIIHNEGPVLVTKFGVFPLKALRRLLESEANPSSQPDEAEKKKPKGRSLRGTGKQTSNDQSVNEVDGTSHGEDQSDEETLKEKQGRTLQGQFDFSHSYSGFQSGFSFNYKFYGYYGHGRRLEGEANNNRVEFALKSRNVEITCDTREVKQSPEGLLIDCPVIGGVSVFKNNGHDTLVHHHQIFPWIRMTKEKRRLSEITKLNGQYEGSVPMIIDIMATFDGSDAAHIDVNVKIAQKHIDCKTEAIAETDGQITFPNTASEGDCLGDGVRADKKDPSKYMIIKNSDGTLTFKSDGYPEMKLKKKEEELV